MKRYASSDGFSVVEVLVALFVGAIILSMVIGVVVSFQSSSTALMSKRQVAENTRFSMTRILKDLSSAQSLLRCSVWKSSELQVEYDTYIRRVNNGGDDPSTPVIESGIPKFSGKSADCLESYETGHVLLRVLPNSICWFKDLTPTNDQIDFSKPFQSACLLRGGQGRDAQYDTNGNNIGFSNATPAPMPCAPNSGADDQDTIYYYECSYNDPNMHYFVPNETVYGDWIYNNNSLREVLDLRLTNNSTSYVRKNIFSYTSTNGGTVQLNGHTPGTNTGDILYVNVRMDVRYPTGRIDDDGNEVEGNYRFMQTVLLQGAKTYKDEGAFSDRFTG